MKTKRGLKFLFLYWFFAVPLWNIAGLCLLLTGIKKEVLHFLEESPFPDPSSKEEILNHLEKTFSHNPNQ